MTKKLKRLWVDPEFKRRLKQMAANEDKKISDLTRELAKSDDLVEKIKPKKVRGGFFGPPF